MLVAEHGRAYSFALSGSSARKLKRMDANLLAGRAINRPFFPLTAAELNYDFELDRVLRFGLLPQIQSEPGLAIDSLDAYAANYVREEVQQEALVRNLDSFMRFLEIAALMNGQIVNVAGITRAKRTVGIEGKAATQWRNEYGSALKALIAAGDINAGYGVYAGTAELKDGPLHILPLKRFFKELTAGNVLG